MKCGVSVLVAVFVLLCAAGCSRGSAAATELPTRTSQSTDPLRPTPPLDSGTSGDAPVCPPARGEGTISPAVSIYSISFLVNGLEQVVRGDDTLQALPGDEVQVGGVTICVGSYSGDGGDACVDLVPVDQSGQELVSEHTGTHTVQVTPGFTRISGPGGTWTIGENWTGIAAVLNHWPLEETEDLDCGGGRCERDDRLVVALRGSAGN